MDKDSTSDEVEDERYIFYIKRCTCIKVFDYKEKTFVFRSRCWNVPPMEIKRLFFHFKTFYNKTDASVLNLTDI